MEIQASPSSPLPCGLPVATICLWGPPPSPVKLLRRGRNTIALGVWKEWPLLVAPSLPPRGRMKSYNHTTLISPRMEGVVMATEHFLKHRNGVHYCSVSLAVAGRSVWQFGFHMNFGPRAKPKVECSSERLKMVSVAELFGWGVTCVIFFRTF